jgi:hypothetical protein
MANVRTISSEDIAKYGKHLKGKTVGDTITAQEDYEMRKAAGEDVDPINPETGLTDLPSSVETVMGEEDDSEGAETRRTRSAKSNK